MDSFTIGNDELSGCMLGAAIVPVLRHYGNHCHQSTVNAPFVTLIFVSAYEQVLPQNRHRAVGEESGKMNRIERFSLTLRQRISRLVRKMLSFSKENRKSYRSYEEKGSPESSSLHVKHYPKITTTDAQLFVLADLCPVRRDPLQPLFHIRFPVFIIRPHILCRLQAICERCEFPYRRCPVRTPE